VAIDTRLRKKGAVYHHGNLRRALVEATFRLVDSRGTDGFTLRAAAKLAGVSDGAPYHHFADKEALLAAVAEECFVALQEEMRRAAIRADKDPLTKSRAMGIAYVLFAAKYPARFRLMFGPLGLDRKRHPELARASSAAADLVKTELVRGGAGERSSDPDPTWLGAWALVHGLSVLAVDGHFGAAAKSPRRLEHLVRAAMRSVGVASRNTLDADGGPSSGRRASSGRDRASGVVARR
jgi:AcrR family transcriptional regulator